jgi:hypothetical protein
MEILYCNEILTDEERANVYSYFNTKWMAYSLSTTNIGLVLWGQSNAEGQGLETALPNRLKNPESVNAMIRTGTNTFAQYTAANDLGDLVGSDRSFMVALKEYMRNGQVYLVKVASKGAPLAVEAGNDDFNVSNSELYPLLRDQALELRTKLDEVGNGVFIFGPMIQGERDARNVTGVEAGQYLDNLTDIIDGVDAAGIGANYYIFNKLNLDLVNSTALPAITLANLNIVRDFQQDFVDSKANSFILDMDNFPMDTADYTHFLSPAYAKMGFWVAYRILIKNGIV